MNVVKEAGIPMLTFRAIKSFTDNLMRKHVPNQAQAFSQVEVFTFIEFMMTNPNLEMMQVALCTVFSLYGGMRLNEDHDLCWEDVMISEN